MWCLRYLQLNRFDTLSPQNPNLHREVAAVHVLRLLRAARSAGDGPVKGWRELRGFALLPPDTRIPARQLANAAVRRRLQDSAHSWADLCDALLCQQWRGACAQHIPLESLPDQRDARPVRRRSTDQDRPKARPHAQIQRLLWDATAASRRTLMVMATQKISTQPRAFEELFDIVDRIDTLSPENPNLHREVHFGGKEPPQSLLSESVAKHLDKLHQFPDRLLLRMWMVPSHSRRAVCSLFGPCPASC